MSNLSKYGLSASIEEVTPEMAQVYLSNNAKHRDIKKKNVEKFAFTMEMNDWKLNGKPIILDSNGRLLNGQHRLTACFESGRSFLTVVIRGVDPSTHDDKEKQ